MLKPLSLLCTACGKAFPVSRVHPRCDACGEPLEVERMRSGAPRPRADPGETIFSRYADFFPFTSPDTALSLGEGFTPLLSAPRMAHELGLAGVYLKNETQNPTWSFKDRGTAAGVLHAAALGFRRIGCVSTGNMAVSVAAYGARAGMETVILVSAGIAPEKVRPIAVYGATVVKVSGDYGEMYFESLRAGAEHGVYFINSDVPLRVEGSKTIAFEICEETAFDPPEYVIVPTSAGGNIRGIMKGFAEFRAAGLISREPVVVAAQAEGCAPIHAAFASGAGAVARVARPDTIAHAIENPFPPSGNEVLRRLRATGGFTVAVSDDDMLSAQARLAQEGVFGQPESAAPLAALKKLRDEGRISASARAALVVTGSGLKFTAALLRHSLRITECELSGLSRCVGEALGV